jgi:hypothetical protein
VKTGQIMDLAQASDGRALFAALQAALLVITEMTDAAGKWDQLEELTIPIVRALRVGDALGSNADLAARDAGVTTGHDRVREALR